MRSSSPTDRAARSKADHIRALELRPRDWSDLAIAIVELAIARLRIAASDPQALLRQMANIGRRAVNAQEQVERVRVAMARASHRLPWRTDCLVQALAAQRWLDRLGVETSLRIGVPEKGKDQFEAHAWLMHDGDVITGGDVSEYVPMLKTRVETDQSRTS